MSASRVSNQLIHGDSASPRTPTLSILSIIEGSFESARSAFLVERQTRGLSARTIQFYDDELRHFSNFLTSQGISLLSEIDAPLIRLYLLQLSQTRNQGGVHAAYRTIRAFFRWAWDEFELSTRNPISRVSVSPGSHEPLQGVSLDDVRKLIDACTCDRDRALFSFLIDTGVRKAELCTLVIGDIDLLSGEVTVRHGKGDKFRITFAGRKSLRALRKYLKSRSLLNESAPLFGTLEDETPLTLSGLREIVRRTANRAGIEEPGLHDFRRCCALQLHRNGVDILTISRILGHSTITVTQRYIRADTSDLASAHRSASPADNL